MNATTLRRALWVVLLSTTALSNTVLAQESVAVGAVGAVNPRTTGQQPAASAPRQLVIADSVVLNERIISGPDGAAQVMLLDQSTLTVGPNSDVVIDTYIYDPAQGSGEMVMSLARGAMRFIGGRITKTAPATINVAGAVVALRGGIADMRLVEGGGEVTFLGGEFLTVDLDGQSVTVSRPGGRVLIGLDDAGLAPSLSYAGVIDAASTATLYQSTRTPGRGGAREVAAAGEGAGALTTALEAGAPEAPAISTSGELPASDVLVEQVEVAAAAVGADINSIVVTPTPDDFPVIELGVIRVRPSFTVRAIDGVLPPDGDVIFGRVVDSTGRIDFDTFVLLGPEGEEFDIIDFDGTGLPAPGAGFLEVTAIDIGGGEDGGVTPRIEFGEGVIEGEDAFDVLLQPGQTARLELDILDIADTIVVGAAIIESPISYFLGVIDTVSGPVPVQLTVRDSAGVVRAQRVDLNTFPSFEDFLEAGAASISVQPETTIPGVRGDISLSAGFLSGDTTATFDIDEDVISQFNLFVEAPTLTPTIVDIGAATVESSFAFNVEPVGPTFGTADVSITDASGAETLATTISLSQNTIFSQSLIQGGATVDITPRSTRPGSRSQVRLTGGLVSGDSLGLFNVDELEQSRFAFDVGPRSTVVADSVVVGLAQTANVLSYSLGLNTDFNTRVIGSVPVTLQITDTMGPRSPLTVELNPRSFRTDTLAFGNASLAITPDVSISGLQGDIELGDGLLSGVQRVTYDIDQSRTNVLNLEVID